MISSSDFDITVHTINPLYRCVTKKWRSRLFSQAYLINTHYKWNKWNQRNSQSIFSIKDLTNLMDYSSYWIWRLINKYLIDNKQSLFLLFEQDGHMMCTICQIFNFSPFGAQIVPLALPGTSITSFIIMLLCKEASLQILRFVIRSSISSVTKVWLPWLQFYKINCTTSKIVCVKLLTEHG